MHEFPLSVEVIVLHCSLASLAFIVGLTLRRLSLPRLGAILIGSLFVLLICFDVYRSKTYLPVVGFSFLMGIGKQRSSEWHSRAFVFNVGAAIALLSVHFYNFVGLKVIFLRYFLFSFEFDVLIVAFALTGLTFLLCKIFRVRSSIMTLSAFVVSSIGGYWVLPFMNPVIAIATAVGLIFGIICAQSDREGLYPALVKFGSQHLLVTYALYFFLYTASGCVYQETGSFMMFSPNESTFMGMTLGITLWFGSVAGARWRRGALSDARSPR